MRGVSIVVVVVVVVGMAWGASTPPVWANSFSVPMNLTLRIALKEYKCSLMLHYDASHSRSRWDWGEGNHDETCTRVVGSVDGDPCTQIVNGEWRYVYFPKTEHCCKVCNISQGCGIIKPNWLKGANFVGQKTILGRVCDGWMKKGGEENFYFSQHDAPTVPCLYYEGYPTLAFGKLEWLYLSDSYKEGPQNDDIFAIPPNCDGLCDIKV